MESALYVQVLAVLVFGLKLSSGQWQGTGAVWSGSAAAVPGRMGSVWGGSAAAVPGGMGSVWGGSAAAVPGGMGSVWGGSATAVPGGMGSVWGGSAAAVPGGMGSVWGGSAAAVPGGTRAVMGGSAAVAADPNTRMNTIWNSGNGRSAWNGNTGWGNGWGNIWGKTWDNGWGNGWGNGRGNQWDNSWQSGRNGDWNHDETNDWNSDSHWNHGWNRHDPKESKEMSDTTVDDKYDKDFLTAAVARNDVMSLTATLKESPTTQGVEMDVALSTGSPSTGYAMGSVFVMLTERSRSEDTCTEASTGNIIPRKGSDTNVGGLTISDLALHEFKLSSSTEQKVTVTDLPFSSLRDYAGRGIALCSRTEEDARGEYKCVEKIQLCSKLGWDNKTAKMKPFWLENPDQLNWKK
ncbi:uncharacterized protein LOC121376017 [Gigantopelta aegis]|uniref:uncharacterized protein LOC121376017 n=1 Tax=Gigantopelta aegis TaxID=1735272 RepID=UPI001B888AF1|nr:uncharacterized protein LOC121376017 [Gigantopelta aegis]